jgi:hypothetical protein
MVNTRKAKNSQKDIIEKSKNTYSAKSGGYVVLKIPQGGRRVFEATGTDQNVQMKITCLHDPENHVRSLLDHNRKNAFCLSNYQDR